MGNDCYDPWCKFISISPFVFVVSLLVGALLNFPCGEFAVPCAPLEYSIRNYRTDFNRVLNNTEVQLPLPICPTQSTPNYIPSFTCIVLRGRTLVNKCRIDYELEHHTPSSCEFVTTSVGSQMVVKILECESIVMFQPKLTPEAFDTSDFKHIPPCTTPCIGQCYTLQNPFTLEFFGMWSIFHSTADVTMKSNESQHNVVRTADKQKVRHTVSIDDPSDYKNEQVMEQVSQLTCYSGHFGHKLCATTDRLFVGYPDSSRTFQLVVAAIMSVYGALLYLFTVVAYAGAH